MEICKKKSEIERAKMETCKQQKRDQRKMDICKQQSHIEMRHLPAINKFKRYGRSGRGKFFFDQSIGTFF